LLATTHRLLASSFENFALSKVGVGLGVGVGVGVGLGVGVVLFVGAAEGVDAGVGLSALKVTTAAIATTAITEMAIMSTRRFNPPATWG